MGFLRPDDFGTLKNTVIPTLEDSQVIVIRRVIEPDVVQQVIELSAMGSDELPDRRRVL